MAWGVSATNQCCIIIRDSDFTHKQFQSVQIIRCMGPFEPNSAPSLGWDALVVPLLMPLMASGKQPAL